MPTYPFKCDSCRNEFEIVQTMSADRKKMICPKCKSHASQTYTGCTPLVMLHMQVGGNSGFSKADIAHEKMVKQIERASYDHYHAPSKNLVTDKPEFWEGLSQFDSYKPQSMPDMARATKTLESSTLSKLDSAQKSVTPTTKTRKPRVPKVA